MGIVGFMLVYLLNESKRVELHMTLVFMIRVLFLKM